MSDYDLKELLRNHIFDVDETKWIVSDKIPLVRKEIEQTQIELLAFLQNGNFDIGSILNESEQLIEESKSLIVEIEDCKTDIEKVTVKDIQQCLETFDEYGKELEAVNLSLDLLDHVLKIGSFIKELNSGKEFQSYLKAIEAVSDLMILIDQPAEGVQQLQLYESTNNIAQSIMGGFVQDMFTEWDSMVAYATRSGSETSLVTIELRLGNDPSTLDILNALDKCNKLIEKIAFFAQFLFKEVLKPIIRYDCIVTESGKMITIIINHKSRCRNSYKDIIANVRLLFQYLGNLLNVIVSSTGESIMTMIGRMISNDFCDILVRECLIHTVPNNIIDLQRYSKITTEIEDLQRFLFSVKFFFDEKFSILNYINNIDVLFATKSSQHFLETARSIIIKDLSVTMSIGVESIPENSNEDETFGDEVVDQGLLLLHETIPKSLFYFPRCMISKSAQELLDLVYVVMEHAVQCTDLVSKKLYDTTRLIFELYDALTPYHHENFLQNIPQYVALFYNNCMYLAHNLQTFGDKWLALMKGREVDYKISFLDIVSKLRELGYRHSYIHMQQQRKQLMDNIRTSDLNCIVMKDVLGDNAEAAIRQSLRQLQLLKNVWIGVFPPNVFIKLMGFLVTMFIDDLIQRVCTAEDISMEMAAQLNEMYYIVVQKAPNLFPEGTDLNEQLPHLRKLHELVFILGGSLRDIEIQWDDGQGILAQCFSVDELRNLIKALFQNTQFRANLLAKIK